RRRAAGTPAAGLDADPRDREAVPVDAEPGDQVDVIGGAPVAVACRLGIAAVEAGSRAVDGVVPDRAGPAVGGVRSLDLAGRCGGGPAQARRVDRGLWGGHGSPLTSSSFG